MKTTIDAAGRLVIPKSLRDQVGLRPGAVEITADGAGLKVMAIADGGVEVHEGRMVIPAGGADVSDDSLRDAIEAGRR